MNSHTHEHDHEHDHEHNHDHEHGHAHCHAEKSTDCALAKDLVGKKILTIRSHSGLSGDMFLCGLLCMLQLPQDKVNEILNGIFPSLQGSVKLTEAYVNNIHGFRAEVELPHEHTHRNLADVQKIIDSASMSEAAKELSLRTFEYVAKAEGRVHGKPIEEVHFHEVGALDSILDICFTCELYSRLNPAKLIVSPLPIADGVIRCAHGQIPSPAPAVQALLEDVPVRPFEALGETVTPTAIALLKALKADFGLWPAMKIQNIQTVYGTYEYAGVPNGATFALGVGIDY